MYQPDLSEALMVSFSPTTQACKHPARVQVQRGLIHCLIIGSKGTCHLLVQDCRRGAVVSEAEVTVCRAPESRCGMGIFHNELVARPARIAGVRRCSEYRIPVARSVGEEVCHDTGSVGALQAEGTCSRVDITAAVSDPVPVPMKNRE